MVKPYWKYALAVVLLMVIMAVAGFYWLLATTSGARWLRDELVRRSPSTVEVGPVEGSLCNDL